MSEFDSQDTPDINTDTFPLTAAQRRELDSRIESYLENPLAGSSWDEVKIRLIRITKKIESSPLTKKPHRND